MTYDGMDRLQAEVAGLLARAMPGPWQFQVIVPQGLGVVTPSMRAATEALARLAPELAQALVDGGNPEALTVAAKESKEESARLERENEDLSDKLDTLRAKHEDVVAKLHAAEERIQVLVKALAAAGADVPPPLRLL